MKVYRLTLNPSGDYNNAPKILKMIPYIPSYTINSEDNTIKRIPCCPTIIGCIESLNLPQIYDDMIDDGKFIPGMNSIFIVHLYSANVSADMLYQPSIKQVPDAWITGEFWIMDEVEFTLEKTYVFSKQFDLPEFPYSRYSMTQINDMIIDRVGANVVYGDLDNFSFISLNIPRMNKGYKEGSYNHLLY